MEKKDSKLIPSENVNDNSKNSKRDFLSKIFITFGVILAYGLLVFEGLFFIVPKKRKTDKIKIYGGRLKQYKLGTVRAFYDLQGNEILIMRTDESGLRAFSSVCPHLGCRVHWEGDKNEFFCPCHKGIFNSEGVAISGPPADAHQSLKKVSVEVDEKSQIVYIEVNKPGRMSG
ncbi:MAG: Rieske (2Fe-2S) protein [Deltaproteobacteria bacterium]|nr:Rieske (2Fe-2S) protein [Deltaproteobacteria bacterium]